MKIKEIFTLAKDKCKKDIKQFMKDMRASGLKLQFYQGRNFWNGPAVVCENIQDVLSVTRVRCYYDNLGKSYIVYPRQSLSDYWEIKK
jgi:hypothetical protein